jgi:hypothetical protein
MNPAKNSKNQFFHKNVILAKKQGNISNGLKKIIITFLLLFLLFAIKEEALAGFEDGKPTLKTPVDKEQNVRSLNTYFIWSDYTKGGITARSFKIRISGPGIRIEKCVIYKSGEPCDSGKLTYSSYPCHTLSVFEQLHMGKPACKYRWKVQAWEETNCKGKHSQWSDIRTFTTEEGTDKCPPVPGVAYGPAECCKLKYSFTDVDGNCEKGRVVGSPDPGAWCDWNKDGIGDVIREEERTIHWGICCFLNSLYNFSDWLLWIIFPLATLVFLFAGYQFLASGGDPGQVSKARGMIFWGLIGVLIVFLAKFIVAVIKATIS